MNLNNNDWATCFESFHLLSLDVRQVLRRCAAEHLVERGCEEVGSSDISHELFAMWNGCERNWEKVMLEEFGLFVENSK